MTTSEFSLLSPQEQESYLNDGGDIVSDKFKTISSSERKDTSAADISVENNATERCLVVPPPVVASSKREEKPVDAPVTELINSTAVDAQPAPDLRDKAHIDPTLVTKPDGFEIEDPVELLFLLDDDIASGEVKLHAWQVQFMIDFAQQKHDKNCPFYAAMRAANGSGKDKYIVAACVVWLCMRYSLARGIVTNGSGDQLDNQTEAFVRFLCNKANLKFAGGKELIWKCNYRYYECIPTQSPIVLFATDEPNKAEGYHPLKAGGRMAIFASEAKAIPDSIFTSLTRCTGFTHRVDVSSPGLPVGYFFETCSGALKRKELKSVIGLPASTVIEYHITAFDCPHITPNEIKAFASKLPLGENDPVYKSGILAEFTTTDEMVVIPTSFVHYAFQGRAEREVQWISEPYNKAGLDLSDGGAETVLVIRNGNKMIGIEAFRFADSTDTINYLEELFDKWNLKHKESTVNADICGMGKIVVDILRSRGWSNLRYIDSRHKAAEPKIYKNRGTELFFNTRLLLQNKEIIGLYDKQLISQLCTRFYKLADGVIRQLLSKIEMKAKGFVSPDRADGFNLCFFNYKSTVVWKDFSDNTPDVPVAERPVIKPQSDFSLKVWANAKADSLDSFQRNVSKRQPIDRLKQELDKYISSMKDN